MGFINLQALSDTERRQFAAGHFPLGHHPVTNDVFVTQEIDRFSGTYLVGVAGSGKSGELENLILTDAAKGHPVVVVDPHGDLVDKVIASLPAHLLRKTFVLDMLDEDWPFGINLFGLSGKPKNSKEKAQAVDRVMHVLEVLWPDVLTQQHLPLYVRTATIALIHTPGMTMLHMRRFLTDRSFRDRILTTVPDHTVHDIWAEHDQLSAGQQLTRIQPLLNRLGAIFVGRDLIQNIVGQQTTISFRRAIEHREIILIKLPTNQLEQDARLVGTIIVAQISAALFSFADLPEHERPGFSLYVDEFQNFSTPDFARMFTEGRKFGMRVTLAHQLRGQLLPVLQDATASARTKICFQLKADDAREMAQYFPAPNDGRLEEVEAHATAVLLKDPGQDPYVRALTDTYLRPLQSQRKGGRIRMDVPGVTLGAVLWLGYDAAAKKAKEAKPPEEEDPTQYLDDLLRDVMQRRNPNWVIPPKAVIGFANCGRGFYKAVRRLHSGFPELQPQYLFPAQLVSGNRWLAAPKNGYEQFLHFVFVLRHAMRYLAAHPLGKRADASNAAVAQLLTQMPRRQALVRSGDDIGRIRTYDTPAKLTGADLDERMTAIREQTHAKYCRPRAQVERVLGGDVRVLEPTSGALPAALGATALGTTAPAQPAPVGTAGTAAIAGWEEVDEP